MNEQSGSGGRRRYLAVSRDMLSGRLSIPMDAQTLAEFLRLNPHVAAESRDDAKCKAFMGELGMLDLFTRSKEPNLSVLTFRNHVTHWIVGLLWSGYPKPDQNGYRVFCIPKQQVPEEGVKDFVQYVMENYGGYDQEDVSIELDPNWRKDN
jgi:hypothetical protein